AQSRGLVVTRTLETVLNAVIVEATDDDLTWLRAQPEVKSAEYSPAIHVHLDYATAIIGAPQIWTQLGGEDQAGRNIKVGVLDSGIDQTHPMFNDTGFTAPSGFPKTDAADQAFTSNKIIAARNFTTEGSVLDGLGHGTFVASVIAGRRVATPVGTTING